MEDRRDIPGTGSIRHEACEALLDALPYPVCVVNQEGLIISLNRAMATLCGGGRRPADSVGMPAGEVLQLLPFQVQEAIFAALRTGGGRRATIKWNRAGQEPLVLESSVSLLVHPGSTRPYAALWTAIVTPVVVPSRETIALETSRKKGKEILSVVRHDILNQLTILIGFLQFSEDFIEDPRLKDFIGKEEAAGQIIQALIEFTRDFQDLAVEDPSWMPLADIVKSSLERIDAGGVRIEVQVGETEVFASPLVRHVFATLVKNALDHARGLTRVRVSLAKDGIDLLVIVEDDGPGIAPGERKTLFDRGHGRNKGYSLWLAREILAITGASIRENGREGEGARFEIRVPEGMWRSGPGTAFPTA